MESPAPFILTRQERYFRRELGLSMPTYGPLCMMFICKTLGEKNNQNP